jgi:hypothetical protein
MTLIQSVADAVATAAPRLAAASPTSAAVFGAAAYALTRWMARDAGVSPSRR